MSIARKSEAGLRYDRSANLDGNDSLSEIARLIAPDSTVLDLGAATGKLGLYLRERKNCVVDGVEVDADTANIARPNYRKLLELDLESVGLNEHFSNGVYNAIVCADVLEHLRDPGRLLEQLPPLLAKGGRVLLSVPNIGYAAVIAELLEGSFKYRPTGLLDSTHLRFFTRFTLLDFLADHGFGALSVRSVVLEPKDTEFAGTAFERLPPSVRQAVLDAPDAMTYQFIIEAVPGSHRGQFAQLLRRPQLRFGLQAFWAGLDEPYDEKRSVAATAQMGESAQEVELRLPVLPRIGKLRVDVADRPGFIHLHGIRIVSSGDQLLWEWDGDPSSLPARNDLIHFSGPLGTTWLSTTHDPCIELPLTAAVLERLSGASVVLEVGWPASADHVVATDALAAQERRWAAESKSIAARVAEFEEQLDQAANERRAMQAHLTEIAEQLASVRWILRPMRFARSIGRFLLRRRIEFSPISLVDLSITDEGWLSTGTDPHFELKPHKDYFPSGWVLLHFEMEQDAALVNPPCIYVNRGDGYSEASCIQLPYPKDGAVRAIVKLPPAVRGIRFDPLDRKGFFRLGSLAMKEIGKVEAALRVLAPLARRVLTERGRARLVLSKAWQTFREGGFRALKERIRNRTRASPQSYPEWVRQFDTLTPNDKEAIRARVEAMERKPLFSIVMPVYDTPERWLRRAIDSVLAQLYPNWELCIADDASNAPHVRRVLQEYSARNPRIKVTFRAVNGHISATSNDALALASGEFAVLLDHDDELPEHALYLVAEELAAFPDTDLIYSDEDKIDEEGQRYNPYFKPDWDSDLLGSQNYFSHLGVYRLSLVREVGGFRKGVEGSQDYDLVLRCTARTQKVRHIPHVLYHWRAIPGSAAAATGAKSYAQTAAGRALKDHFAAVDPRIRVEPGAYPTTYRVRRPLPDPAPLVTLIIPTRDGVEVLRRCIDSIQQKTRYPAFELLIVDNESSDPTTLAYLDELRVTGKARILSYPEPFNYSAINNLAARNARGEVLCLFNNDVEVIGAEWLEELVSQAVRPEIGGVGAKLLYPNDTIQHAGVIMGLFGVAGHLNRDIPRGAPGYFGRAQMIQQMSVVTAACMAVRKSVYQEMGGLDEEHLPVAFNDVDFCLRMLEAGYRNLYTPFAELYHHESYTRGSDTTPEKQARFAGEIDYMQQRWGHALQKDRAYNPNLSLFSLHSELSWPPRAPRPWKPGA